MNSLALRKAGPGDREFAYRVRRAAFREYVEKISGWDEDEQWKLHARRFESQVLLPEHQGAGIGRECVSLIMEEAHRLGLPVRLRVLKVNPRALAFYRRLGFMRTGETDTHDLLERTHDNGSLPTR